MKGTAKSKANITRFPLTKYTIIFPILYDPESEPQE
jgi:hypothetical protein